MNRRELLKMIAAATGTAMIGGGAAFLGGCATPSQTTLVFSDQDILLLDEVAETIMPRTETPGAKDAKVGEFMRVFVTDCYTPQEQAIFHTGLASLEADCQKIYNRSFMALPTKDREEFLSQLDKQAFAQSKSGSPHTSGPHASDPHYFTMVKQLTLFGFFTSEVGATQVLRHVAIPGYFDGALAYKPGDRAWATRW